MAFLKAHKIIVILAIIVAVGAWWILSSLGGSSSSNAVLTTQPLDSNLSPADQNLVSTLLQLRAVKLDGGIFSEPAFQALKDFSTQIIPEPVGRPNPFLPLPVGGVTSASSSHAAAIFTPGR